MTTTICPYPGLRPFNEEESIFFKGREQQVERLVKRLEEKKFLMVNGASGDGKSSLIYAGVIPYAKAGFFKAKYNNWIVADFRPERSPLKNISASICKQLKIEDAAKTEKELGYGFSALCDLYKSSSYYIDETKPEWQNADEKERKTQKRKAANLLVLVDQFEEFFTNPENYHNGIPSNESQKTVNLLLETYKLAAAHDLPIYVVCTMRSDYIGQCAAFRGLPEAIGYSQFFVPRLKRQEIEQVIEGPAELAGCKISKRLTQTLLNSLTDGFDQLPILQHALHQIWKSADMGGQEMDVIHLAKVGGISPLNLNSEDRAKFRTWEASLPEYKKQLFENPSLSNVLNAHANELYLTAHLSYKEKFGKEISIEHSQKIIKAVFQCLTKMDASRAVRNRMTLQEITNIINDDKISITKVDQLLQIYRIQGNTFLQPFIINETDSNNLDSDSVLDITHESLIRNWTQLSEWAYEEYENLQNYLDFNKQLQRWVNSNFNSGYLLPIGPLSFFENWIQKLNPSKYWIHRYEEFKGNEESQLSQAEERLNQSLQFIEKSGKKLIVTRTILKYGARRISIAAGIILLISLCTYFYFDFRKKQNDYVIHETVKHGKEMLSSTNISTDTKAEFLINNDRLNEITSKPYEFDHLLTTLDNDTLSFDIAYAMISKCLIKVDSTNYDQKGAYTFRIFDFLFKNFEKETSEKIELLSKGKKVSYSRFKRNRLNDFLSIAAWMKHDSNANYKSEVDTIIDKTIFKSQWFLTEAIKSKIYQKFLVEQNILYTISTLLAIDDSPNYSEFIHLISPLEDDVEAVARFDSIFKSNATYRFNCLDLPKQGGYEILALLYAAQFKSDITARQKIELLMDYNLFQEKNYMPTDVYLTLMKFNTNNTLSTDFVIERNSNSELTKAQFIGKATTKLFQSFDFNENFPSGFIHCFIPQSAAISIFDSNEKLLLNAPQNDSTKMNMAVFYKKRGTYYAEKLKENSKAEMYFTAAMNYYQIVSEEYKLQYHYFDKENWSNSSIPNYKWFLAPGSYIEYMSVYRNCRTTSIGNYYLFRTSPFFEFLVKKWRVYTLSNATLMNAMLDDTYFSNDSLSLAMMKFLSDIKVNSEEVKPVLYLRIGLYESYQFLKNKDMKSAANVLDSLFKTFPENIDNDGGWIKANALLLAEVGDTARINKLLSYISSTQEKNKILLDICYRVQKGEGVEYTFYYLNKLIENNLSEPKIGMAFYRVLGMIGGAEVERFAEKKFRNTPELMKPKALDNLVLGTAENGNYFKAKKIISSNVSETKELLLMNQILHTDILKRLGKNFTNCSKGDWNDALYYQLNIEPIRNTNEFQFNSLE